MVIDFPRSIVELPTQVSHFYVAVVVNDETLQTQVQCKPSEQKPNCAVARSGKLTTDPRQDWGEAIDVSLFYGRSQELATLKQWILQDRCRLIAILGMGGVGKTSLSVKLAQQIQDQFEYVFWRSLRNAFPSETLLSDLIAFLSNQRTQEGAFLKLMNYLQNHRCLIVLNHLEVILEPEQIGQCCAEYQSYSELLQMLGEINHQSCVILTSCEKPTSIAVLEGQWFATRSFCLSGSPEVVQKLLQISGIHGSIEQRQCLRNLYDHNPFALKIITATIRSLFAGDISE